MTDKKHESFASMMNTFGKLTELESKIDKGIQYSKVPWGETRKFLKGISQAGVMNTPLYQYMQNLFYEIGLGTMDLEETNDFRYLFSIPDCSVCDLFLDVRDKRVCNPTVEALARFFHEDLGISCSVKEMDCKNMSANTCRFLVEVEPLSVYQILLDDFDMKIMAQLRDVETSTKDIAVKLKRDPEDLQYNLDILRYYQIITKNNKLTDAGEAYKNFIDSHPPGKGVSDFDPPWKSMEKISSAIAATQSFAEAMVEISEQDVLPWKVPDAQVVEMRDKAKDKKSFAELMKQFSKED